MMRAPTKAMAPLGASACAVKPMSTPFASGSSGAAGTGGVGVRNVKVRPRSRVKSSGPSDQCTRRLSPDQWMLKPASCEMRAVG